LESTTLSIRAAFIFIAPQGSPQQHRTTVITPEVEVTTVAVADYASACQTAVDLLAEGITAFELCGGFGNEGVAAVARAVRGRAVVGVVRFDHHPGLGHRSGDELF
jgi:cytosine/adenosine deaminase-related metal-dependent hydrolase